MKEEISICLDDKETLVRLGKALSVEHRIDILGLLDQEQLNINEIAERLSIPPSTASLHVKVLEESNLIQTIIQPGVRGSKKVCIKQKDKIILSLKDRKEGNEYYIPMPIGNYVDYKVKATCGIVSEKGPIDEEDEPRCFYNPDRTKAQLLWFGQGYVEYRFPNNILRERKAKAIQLSMEICSEDHEYNHDHPSDITVWINGTDSGTYRSPSDFGGRRGKFNPSWWPDKNTQYGELITWTINEYGTFIQDSLVDNKKLEEYELWKSEYISVRIGMKEDAKHIGGINLFGEHFGDYNQNIILKIEFNQ